MNTLLNDIRRVTQSAAETRFFDSGTLAIRPRFIGFLLVLPIEKVANVFMLDYIS